MGLKVDSLRFVFPGSKAIPLRDPASDKVYDDTAAFVRRATIQVQVVFRNDGASGTFKLRAVGSPGGMQEQKVSIPKNGLSSPVTFTANFSLINQISTVALKLTWQVYISDKSSYWDDFQKTSHTIYTTWQAFTPDPGKNLFDWVYLPLIQWTCAWAAGADNEKAICDAIIKNLYRSGLKYGPGGATIRDLLLAGQAMCGTWSLMFQYMAYCQGVTVHRRCFLVDWRDVTPAPSVQWNAIVCTAPGLNQTTVPPPNGPMVYHDNDTAFPISSTVAIQNRIATRWRFWGTPGGFLDGHCIDFLVFGGALYLYDPSFGTGPFNLGGMPLPPDNFSILGGNQLAIFKANYLNTAVPYMMGSLANGSTFYETIPATQNGMTVKTAVIPDVVGSFPEITFYWAA